ncbi:hypothetical protein [Metabacillus halosaccharovorans]|uniref:hypothetical protein n=1 Tax=Metabacillus halosaccharovorans TaxID=930124 RepID=UPI001C1FEA71|nr:hypothetical protein [Metabacillus halosaccharovorans]MBU7594434.1 hypothetical protein [Metabacillus halosaccharovorans]
MLLGSLFITYYVGAAVYLIFLLVLKREGVVLRFLILLSCPFIGIFLMYAMTKKVYSKDELPDWLLRREQYDDFVLKTPDIEEETNIIPFNDALILNDNKTKRKMLIDLLKGEFLQHVGALELALQSDDSETSHYAATAVQQAKSDLLKDMRKLEGQLANNNDVFLLEAYRDLIKHYIRIEFLDERTRRKYTHKYIQTIDQILEHSPANGAKNYLEKIEAGLYLAEYHMALETAEQLLSLFPEEEDAYFAVMNVHFTMKNKTEFQRMITQLRATDIKLSPDKLNQLRFWLQGEKK